MSQRGQHPNSLANLKRGNPGNKGSPGRPTDEAIKLAQDYSPSGIRKLISLAKARKTKDSVRVRAIEILLNRAMGKPHQSVDLQGGVELKTGGKLIIQPVADGVDIPE